MLDYETSSHSLKWIFSPQHLDECRARANREAREAPKDQPPRPSKFASGYSARRLQGLEPDPEVHDGEENDDFITPREEHLLVSYYAGVLPCIIGPGASSRRLQQNAKIPATANLLLRRFYLSNSVVSFDPKAVMVAAAFLASKVEEGIVHVQALSDATKDLGVVPVADVIRSELHLLAGVAFEVSVCHPHRALSALWEDLRVFLKSPDTRRFATIVNAPHGHTVVGVTGGDLRPIHDRARALCEDVCVSDVPLTHDSGQIALAAVVAANQDLLRRNGNNTRPTSNTTTTTNGSNGNNNAIVYVPTIDMEAYVRRRFGSGSGDGGGGTSGNASGGDGDGKVEWLLERVRELVPVLLDLRTPGGRYGCGNYPVDVNVLKAVTKKLKKCRLWGNDKKKKKKGKKRAAAGDGAPSTKKAKVEE